MSKLPSFQMVAETIEYMNNIYPVLNLSLFSFILISYFKLHNNLLFLQSVFKFTPMLSILWCFILPVFLIFHLGSFLLACRTCFRLSFNMNLINSQYEYKQHGSKFSKTFHFCFSKNTFISSSPGRVYLLSEEFFVEILLIQYFECIILLAFVISVLKSGVNLNVSCV